MTRQKFLQCAVCNPRRALSIAALLALMGCAGVQEEPSGAIAVTVKPGQTGQCDTSPCQVSLIMPAGSGSYEVTANEVSLGSFPAGETANLGNFFQSQAFQVKGAGVPKAYVYIPQEP
jgi:hypothetical protein